MNANEPEPVYGRDGSFILYHDDTTGQKSLSFVKPHCYTPLRGWEYKRYPAALKGGKMVAAAEPESDHLWDQRSLLGRGQPSCMPPYHVLERVVKTYEEAVAAGLAPVNEDQPMATHTIDVKTGDTIQIKLPDGTTVEGEMQEGCLVLGREVEHDPLKEIKNPRRRMTKSKTTAFFHLE